jgi:hypothetical protein
MSEVGRLIVRVISTCSTADSSAGGTDSIAEYEWDLGDGRKKKGRVVNPKKGEIKGDK